MDYVSQLGYKPRLLLVEDNKLIRKKFERSLRRAGFRVTSRDDGCKVEKLLRNKQIDFDVVLTDSEMPRMDGYKAVTRARNFKILGQDVLILATSDVDDNECYWAGIAHYAEFFDKNRYYFGSLDIGQAAIGHYWNFVNGSDIWRTRLIKKERG